MAWYDGATKYELQPESDSQPAIRPTQFIIHSIAAPWTAKRTYQYWRDSTNLESHFGLGYAGDLGQFIGTETKADANYQANRRPDGTGAVSIETASNTSATDNWTDEQVEELIELGSWLHHRHGIPLRICRSHDDPGYGYHRLHPQWAVGGGTVCPGNARVKQFKDVVFPGIVARATGKTTTTEPQEDTVMPITKLHEPNPTDVELELDEWMGLAFKDAVIHSGPRQLVGPLYVQLTFGQDSANDAEITGRFVSTDAQGLNRSGYGDLGPFPARGTLQFLHNVNVPAGRQLRFEVFAASPLSAPVILTHRLVTGDWLNG
ncbi:peptidoglycan recognition protein family protein [Streptomyces sp. NBC_00306]|uniref:peptidoglycan recognition protein family protein n=1 Tax=Streptomyces sp. NBC_00306 TaxID=2975708 RepID=UPI002E2BB364|nr:N-acetylmuramoyl-L-alanine amidase [Streptomyces sp. NBC_00306]